MSHLMTKSILEDEKQEKFADNIHEHENVSNYFRLENAGHEVCNLKKKLKALVDTNTTFCSFELLSINNDDFYQRFIAEMSKYQPLFYALPSHTNNKGHFEFPKSISMFPNNILLHLIANDLTRTDVMTILKEALKCGITNVFALRGDSITANADFPYAIDLVRFIKIQFGDTFCICVAGYPEMHPESPSKELDLFYLKEKVNAGADFIITQICFEANVFIKFANDCKEFGINVPIIPGILPIHNYSCLEKIAKVCNVKIPKNILNCLQPIKDDDDKVRNYGIELSTNTINDIIASGTTHGFHLFTFNRTSLSSEICKRLKYFKVEKI